MTRIEFRTEQPAPKAPGYYYAKRSPCSEMIIVEKWFENDKSSWEGDRWIEDSELRFFGPVTEVREG